MWSFAVAHTRNRRTSQLSIALSALRRCSSGSSTSGNRISQISTGSTTWVSMARQDKQDLLAARVMPWHEEVRPRFLTDREGWMRTPDEHIVETNFDLSNGPALLQLPTRMAEWAGRGILRVTLLFGSLAVALALILTPIASQKQRTIVDATAKMHCVRDRKVARPRPRPRRRVSRSWIGCGARTSSCEPRMPTWENWGP